MSQIKTKLLLILGLLLGVSAFLFLRAGINDSERKALEPQLYGLTEIYLDYGESLPEKVWNVQGNEAVTQIEVDTSQVRNMQPGTYYIRYTYEGKNGKKYISERKCIVSAPEQEEIDKVNQKEIPSEKPESNVPKTGEAWEILKYIIIMAAAATVILCHPWSMQKREKI